MMEESLACEHGCTYCNLKDSKCDHYVLHKGSKLNFKCDGFVLGKCFRCAMYKNAHNKKSYIYCLNLSDYCGCANFMDAKGEEENER